MKPPILSTDPNSTDNSVAMLSTHELHPPEPDIDNYLDDDNDDDASTQIDEAELRENYQHLNESDITIENLEYGPLNKSIHTKMLEAILEKLDEDSEIRFELDDYILMLGDETYNLSVLINNANLSHLTLNKKLIEKLAKLVEKLTLTPPVSPLMNPVFNQLHPIQQFALKIYAESGYQPINQFFRQEEVFWKSLDGRNVPNKNHLAAFILGCLINDALNKIPNLADNLPEKKKLKQLAYHYQIKIDELNTKDKYSKFLEQALKDKKITETELQELQQKYDSLHFLFPRDTVLDRGEVINNEVIMRKVNAPTRFPALTSFSKKVNGASIFHTHESTRTRLHNAPTSYELGGTFAGEDEAEIILQHGGQVITTNQDDGSLSATFVRSPALEPKDHYHSDLALRHVFTQYLCKEYKEERSAIQIKGQTIYRPYHGLAHTYRVMLGIEMVTEYFSEHASDPEFRNFCKEMSPDDTERLRIAAAFSISGRESERSAKSDLKRYERYRAKSSEHFLNYACKSSLLSNIDIRDRLYSVVRYMGNPHYANDFSELNHHPRKKERKIREFYNRILTVAHKLDLVRCFSPNEFKSAMQMCVDHSHQSPEQNQAYNGMINYFIELNKAHGDNVLCDLDSSGQLKSCFIDYQPIFADVSLSFKRVKEVAETVPKPTLAQNCHFKIVNNLKQ